MVLLQTQIPGWVTRGVCFWLIRDIFLGGNSGSCTVGHPRGGEIVVPAQLGTHKGCPNASPLLTEGGEALGGFE